jgi:hypothetical protein
MHRAPRDAPPVSHITLARPFADVMPKSSARLKPARIVTDNATSR